MNLKATVNCRYVRSIQWQSENWRFEVLSPFAAWISNEELLPHRNLLYLALTSSSYDRVKWQMTGWKSVSTEWKYTENGKASTVSFPKWTARGQSMVMVVSPPHRVFPTAVRATPPRDLCADAIREVCQVHTYYEPDIERHFLTPNYYANRFRVSQVAKISLC